MINILNLKKSMNNKTFPKKRLIKKVVIQPFSLDKNNSNKKENQINNLRISTSLTIFPISRNRINLKYIKKEHSRTKPKNYFSTHNINNIETSNNNKNAILTYKSFNSKYMKPKTPVDRSIYTILAISKNKILYEYEKDIINNHHKKKINNLKTLINKDYINEFNEKNKNENILENSQNSMIYLSCLNNNFINSEKYRFYNMMEKLNKIKQYIESNPENKYEIIKNFFISVGLNNKKYLTKNKMNTFIEFIKKDFIVDPSKTFNNNILNIIDKNNNFLYYQNNLKHYGNILSTPKITLTKRIKNIMHINNNLYKNKNLKFNSYNKLNINKNNCDLNFNMNKQKEMNKRNTLKDFFDIVKEPEKVMNCLEEKIKEGKNEILYDKNYADWSKNIRYYYYNDINDINFNSYDLDKLKKKNLLTEYACFQKAKNNYDFNQIKNKYNV